MAADLHIHIFEGITENDLKEFFSNTLGSKYFAGWDTPQKDYSSTEEEFGEGSTWKRVIDTPSIWIGEVSWLKAALFGDSEKFVPDPVQQVTDIVGEDLPIIDEGLILKIEAALKLANSTSYSIVEPGTVVQFLREHFGKKVFTISH